MWNEGKRSPNFADNPAREFLSADGERNPQKMTGPRGRVRVSETERILGSRKRIPELSAWHTSSILNKPRALL